MIEIETPPKWRKKGAKKVFFFCFHSRFHLVLLAPSLSVSLWLLLFFYFFFPLLYNLESPVTMEQQSVCFAFFVYMQYTIWHCWINISSLIEDTRHFILSMIFVFFVVVFFFMCRAAYYCCCCCHWFCFRFFVSRWSLMCVCFYFYGIVAIFDQGKNPVEKKLLTTDCKLCQIELSG